jgi:hypothetical protein
MVAEALHDNAWIRDLGHRTGFTSAHLSQLVTLWNLVQGTTLRQDREDASLGRKPHTGSILRRQLTSRSLTAALPLQM